MQSYEMKKNLNNNNNKMLHNISDDRNDEAMVLDYRFQRVQSYIQYVIHTKRNN